MSGGAHKRAAICDHKVCRIIELQALSWSSQRIDELLSCSVLPASVCVEASASKTVMLVTKMASDSALHTNVCMPCAGSE